MLTYSINKRSHSENENIIKVNFHFEITNRKEQRCIIVSFSDFADIIQPFIDLCFYINHCVKSVRIQSYTDQYFPKFGLNTQRYGLSLRIQSECEKIRTRITPNTNTFYAANITILNFVLSHNGCGRLFRNGIIYKQINKDRKQKKLQCNW